MKKLIKKTLTQIFDQPFTIKMGSRLFGSGVPIFMIHRVRKDNSYSSGTPASYLRQCLDYLVKHKFTFLSVEQLCRALETQTPLPDKSVVFTIDDGFADQVELAAPVFIEYQCPVTIFLISDMIDGKLWPWDDKVAYLITHCETDRLALTLNNEQYDFALTTPRHKITATESIQKLLKTLPPEETDQVLKQLIAATNVELPATPPEEFRPLTWDQAREFEQKGISFAPHTRTHRILSKLDAESSFEELSGSWQRLKDELSSPVPVFCYPTGRYSDYGPREVEILKNLGFIGAVSTISAHVELGDFHTNYRFNLPRLYFPKCFENFTHDCSYLGYIRNRSNNIYRYLT